MALVAPAMDAHLAGRKPRAHMRNLSVSSSNALENFGHFEDVVQSKRVVVLLDYDGTLTPIVSDPSQALLSDHTRAVLTELAQPFVVGIVSGRSLQKVRDFVQVPGLFYAGSHGFDITGPHAESMRYQVAADQLPNMARMRDQLIDRVSRIKGAAVEDNIFSVSVHYRNCEPSDVQQVYEVVHSVKSEFPSVRFCTGKMVYELKPDISWDKGRAMLWLLQALELNGRDDVFTIYIGDDTTDEDAFEVFSEHIMQGVGIVVTDENKMTGANFSLRNPDEVATFLELLVESRRKANTRHQHHHHSTTTTVSSPKDEKPPAPTRTVPIDSRASSNAVAVEHKREEDKHKAGH